MAGSQSPLDQEEQKRILNLIKDFVGERLRRNGIHIAGYEEEEIINSEDRSINEIALTLRRVGDELELADAQFVQNMCTRLQITPNTAYSMFQGISDKIFVSGKNWGRIVAFLTFGSSLAVHCAVNPEMGHRYVDRIVDWIYVYMTTKLGPWIVQHGGWVCNIMFLSFALPIINKHIFVRRKALIIIITHIISIYPLLVCILPDTYAILKAYNMNRTEPLQCTIKNIFKVLKAFLYSIPTYVTW